MVRYLWPHFGRIFIDSSSSSVGCLLLGRFTSTSSMPKTQKRRCSRSSTSRVDKGISEISCACHLDVLRTMWMGKVFASSHSTSLSNWADLIKTPMRVRYESMDGEGNYSVSLITHEIFISHRIKILANCKRHQPGEKCRLRSWFSFVFRKAALNVECEAPFKACSCCSFISSEASKAIEIAIFYPHIGFGLRRAGAWLSGFAFRYWVCKVLLRNKYVTDIDRGTL